MAHLDTDLLKPTDVARRLGVSRSWVYDAAATGRIPCVRMGGPEGPLRFLPDDVEAWLDHARRNWLPSVSIRLATAEAAADVHSASSQLHLEGLIGDPP